MLLREFCFESLCVASVHLMIQLLPRITLQVVQNHQPSMLFYLIHSSFEPVYIHTEHYLQTGDGHVYMIHITIRQKLALSLAGSILLWSTFLTQGFSRVFLRSSENLSHFVNFWRLVKNLRQRSTVIPLIRI